VLYVDYGFLSLVPPVLAIALAVLTKNIIVSLFVAVFVSSVILADWNPFLGLTRMIHDYMFNAVAEDINMQALFMMVVIGGFVEANHAATEAQRKLASATKATQAAQNDLAKAVSGTTGALTEQAKKAAEQLADASLTQLTAIGKAREGFISHADPTRASSEWNSLSLKEQQEATRSASEISDAYEVLKAKLTATGLSMENLNGIVAEGGDGYKKLVSELRAAGEEGERAAGYLEKSRKQIEDTIAAARRVDPAAAQAAKGIDVLADSSANANDKLNALESIMQAMGLARARSRPARRG